MSQEEIIVALAVIVVFGIGAQWLARRRDFPALLLLLPAGLLAGNVGDLVQPEELFGDTLFPGVTLLVGLLLFSSGLRLRFAELPVRARGPVIRLNTVAAMITLLGAAGVTWLVIRPSWHLALLTGAILVVSGPTVVGPLLDSVRPREPVDSILRWEGTVLDPIGATMGVIALNLVLAAQREGIHPVFQMGGRLALGVGVGLVAGALLVFVMSRFLVTDEMEAAVSLLFAVLAFSVAEYFLSEAGLFATVTLGLVVANQRVVPTGRIEGFGETLEVIIIGGLFVVLGALVDIDDLVDRGWRIAVVVALLVVLVRPLSVAVSLFRTRVDLRGRAMIAWLDPRGVVAAATAASFAGTLALAGIDAEFLLPVVFGVILGTGVLYGLTAAPVAAALGVRRDP
ncbi:MAG: cation:proton antiporter, partial [Microthrixaceae bacterium]